MLLSTFVELSQTTVRGFNIRYLPVWLAKIYWFSGIIIGKTAWIDPRLPDRTQLRLAAHELGHIQRKQKMSWLKWKWKFALDKQFRLHEEALAYAISCIVFGYQIGPESHTPAVSKVLPAYARLLASKKYKLGMDTKRVEQAINMEILNWALQQNSWVHRLFIQRLFGQITLITGPTGCTK